MSDEYGGFHVGFRGPDIWQVRDGDTAEFAEPFGTREEAERACDLTRMGHKIGYAAGLAEGRRQAEALAKAARMLSDAVLHGSGPYEKERSLTAVSKALSAYRTEQEPSDAK